MDALPVLVGISVVCWFMVYRSLRVFYYERGPEWSCRLMTASHAVLVVILALWSWQFGPDPFSNPGGKSTLTQEITIVISLGYFVVDFIWCVIHQTEGCLMLVHHVVSIVVLSRVLMRGEGGTEATSGLLCLEVSNPVLQVRWFLRSLDRHNTVYFFVTEALFVAIFMYFRMCWGTILCHTILTNSSTDFESKVSCVILYLISVLFMCHIVRYFVMKYVLKHSKRESSGTIISPVTSYDEVIIADDDTVVGHPKYDDTLNYSNTSGSLVLGSPLAHSTSLEESPPSRTIRYRFGDQGDESDSEWSSI